MKKPSLLGSLKLAIACSLVAHAINFGCVAHAQTVETPVVDAAPVAVPVAVPQAPPSFFGGLKEAGQAFVGSFKADTNAVAATNWIGVVFGSYDLQSKKIGYGVAAIYPVTDLIYVGARLENINGTWTTPSLQVQLKKKIRVLGLNVTPFGVGGTAIFNGNVAAYVGAGAELHLFDTTIAGKPLSFGIVGDYEKWGGLSQGASNTRVNGGLAIGLKF